MPNSTGHRHDTLATRRVLGGLSVGELARRANVTDVLINRLEAGGSCSPVESQRILDALASPATITSNSQANPTSVLTAAVHAFQTGDTVVLAGITGANADPTGTRIATRVDTTHFTVPINCTVAGGTGGTATIDKASTSVAALN
jgi:hypothetical protein